MKLKQGVWIVACMIGVVVFGGLAVLMGYVAITGAQAANGAFPVDKLVRPALLLLIAGACGGGIFLSPREVEQVMVPEVDEEPAQWIKDMRARNADKDEA
jgi:hypothetical protein